MSIVDHTQGPGCVACEMLDDLADHVAEACAPGLELMLNPRTKPEKELEPADVCAAALVGMLRAIRRHTLANPAMAHAMEWIQAELNEEGEDVQSAKQHRAANTLS